MMQDETMPRFVTTQDIMKKLCVSRNFVTRNITHVVKRIEIPGRSSICFEEADWRNWLMQHASFTRQTQYIDLEVYRTECPPGEFSMAKLIGVTPRDYNNKLRGQYPYVNVEPFDFWDKKLIFPKNYENESGKKLSAEMCYRDMFDQGAVKIQLGPQKTMFYIPDHNASDFFVGADWIPWQGCLYQLNQNKEEQNAERPSGEFELIIRSSPDMREDIISSLRKSFNIKRVLKGMKEIPPEDLSVSDCYICAISAPASKEK